MGERQKRGCVCGGGASVGDVVGSGSSLMETLHSKCKWRMLEDVILSFHCHFSSTIRLFVERGAVNK